jgi:O-antigen/teichoic acid export membrane protein
MLNVAQAAFAYVQLAGDAGTTTYGAKELARGALTDAVVGVLIRMRFALTAIAYAALVAILFLTPMTPALRTTVMLYGFGAFGFAISLEWYYQGLQQFNTLAVLRALRPLLFLGLVWMLAVTRMNASLAAAAFAVAALLTGAAQLFDASGRRALRLAVRRSTVAWRPLLGASAPLGLAAVFITVYYNIDTLFLAAMRDTAAAGIYNAGYKIVLAVVTLGAATMTATLPVLATSSTRGDRVVGFLLSRIAALATVVALPLVAFGALLAKPGLVFLYGPSYGAAAPSFRILLFSAAIILYSAHVGNALLVVVGSKPYLRAVIIGAVVNVVLNLLLIGPWGAQGAAMATVAAELVVAVLVTAWLPRRCWPRMAAALQAAAIAMTGLIVSLPLAWLLLTHAGVVAASVAGGVAYLSIIGLIATYARPRFLAFSRSSRRQ